MIFNQNKFTATIISQKYPLLVATTFLIVTLYVAFFYHNYWIVDQDGILLLKAGEQIINGDGKNVHLFDVPIGGPVFYATLNLVFNDGFALMKLISIISGCGTVLLVFFIIKNIFNYKNDSNWATNFCV